MVAVADGKTADKVVGKLTRNPWDYCGVSRASWYRLMSSGLAPRPVNLPGCRNLWRTADLDKFVDELRTK
jgi:predicted DNA-binding transcriptional regulator AlpA